MNKLSRDDVQGCTNAAGAGSPGAVTAMDGGSADNVGIPTWM